MLLNPILLRKSNGGRLRLLLYFEYICEAYSSPFRSGNSSLSPTGITLACHQSEHEVLSSNVNPPVKTSVFVRRREAMEVQESRASQSCVVDELTQQEGNKHIP